MVSVYPFVMSIWAAGGQSGLRYALEMSRQTQAQGSLPEDAERAPAMSGP